MTKQTTPNPMTPEQQKFAEAYVLHSHEPDIKRAVMYDCNIGESRYYQVLKEPRVKEYIEKRVSQGWNKENEYKNELADALKLITLEGLLVEYSRLLEKTFDPRDRKVILDSVAMMRHKFGSEMENQLTQMVKYTDDQLVELFVDTGTEIIGNERARDVLKTLFAKK